MKKLLPTFLSLGLALTILPKTSHAADALNSYVNSGNNVTGFVARFVDPHFISNGTEIIGSGNGWVALPVKVSGDFQIKYDVFGNSFDVDSHLLLVNDATTDGVDCVASPVGSDTPSINIYNQKNLASYTPFYFATTYLAKASTTGFINYTWTHATITKVGTNITFNVGGQTISAKVTTADLPTVARVGLGYYGEIKYRNISVKSYVAPAPSGTGNTATGVSALANNTTGYANVATGYTALFSNTSGTSNNANGYGSLYSNLTGYCNVANGYFSLNANTTGIYNTANGNQSLIRNTIGYRNVADGAFALSQNTTGFNNIALGYYAGSELTTGSNNIDIGNVGVPGESGFIRIGKQGTQKQTFVAGIFGATAVGGVPVYVTSSGQLGTLTSSAKFKQNIHDMGNVSDALLALRPVTYQYKSDIDPQATPQFGLIAEEVEKVSPDLVVHDSEHQIYTVRYEAVNAMLLNEVQKQHETITEEKKHAQAQDTVIAEQQKLIESLSKRLEIIEKSQAQR